MEVAKISGQDGYCHQNKTSLETSRNFCYEYYYSETLNFGNPTVLWIGIVKAKLFFGYILGTIQLSIFATFFPLETCGWRVTATRNAAMRPTQPQIPRI